MLKHHLLDLTYTLHLEQNLNLDNYLQQTQILSAHSLRVQDLFFHQLFAHNNKLLKENEHNLIFYVQDIFL